MLGGGYGFADAGPAPSVAKAAAVLTVAASVSAAFVIRLTVIPLRSACGAVPETGLASAASARRPAGTIPLLSHAAGTIAVHRLDEEVLPNDGRPGGSRRVSDALYFQFVDLADQYFASAFDAVVGTARKITRFVLVGAPDDAGPST